MENKLKLMTCQLALFIKEGFVRSDEFSFEISRRMHLGNYEPMLIPEAPGMPPEFPRLQISTPKGYQLTLSRLRVDFVMSLPLGIEEDDTRRFHDECKTLLAILEEKGFKFSRVGYIHNYFSVGEAAIEEFIKKATPFRERNFFELSLSVTERTFVNQKECNSLYSFSSAINGAGESGLLAVRDINTVPDKNYELLSSDVGSFMVAALSEIGVKSVIDLVG